MNTFLKRLHYSMFQAIIAVGYLLFSIHRFCPLLEEGEREQADRRSVHGMADIASQGLLLSLFSPLMGLPLGLLIAVLVGGGLVLLSAGLRTKSLAQLIEQRYGLLTLRSTSHFMLVSGRMSAGCGLLVFVALLIEFFNVKGMLLDLWLLEFVATSVLGTLLYVIPALLQTRRMRRMLEARSGEAVQRSASRAFPQPKEAREE